VLHCVSPVPAGQSAPVTHSTHCPFGPHVGVLGVLAQSCFVAQAQLSVVRLHVGVVPPQSEFERQPLRQRKRFGSHTCVAPPSVGRHAVWERQATQRSVVGWQNGVSPLHCAFVAHWTHCFVTGSQTGLLVPAHVVSSMQPTHCPVVVSHELELPGHEVPAQLLWQR
jgi:hypothetical protein